MNNTKTLTIQQKVDKNIKKNAKALKKLENYDKGKYSVASKEDAIRNARIVGQKNGVTR